ncbi:MAG: hypothetical protein WHV44_00140 [Anaerolineales bacterium]
MNELNRKGELIRKYILSLVYEDEIPDVVNQAIDDLVQAAEQSVQGTCAQCGADDWRDAIIPDSVEICNRCGARR